MTDEKNRQPNIEVVDIDSLVADDQNFNRGTDEGKQLIARSFKEHGAGRSVLLDKNNRLVAGNKATEGARQAGIRRVIVVDTEGDEMVAVRRKDVDLDSAEGRKMALLDNLTQQVSLAWDADAIQTVSDQFEGFDPSEYGFEFSTLSKKEIKETEKLSKLEFADVYYTPKEKPNLKLRDCIYTGMFEEKMSYINHLDLPDETKEVMKMLAYRFIKIDFESVANYYAFNATDLEKRAIERLRCVLVDGGIMGFVEDRLLHVVEELDDANYEEGE